MQALRSLELGSAVEQNVHNIYFLGLHHFFKFSTNKIIDQCYFECIVCRTY